MSELRDKLKKAQLARGRTVPLDDWAVFDLRDLEQLIAHLTAQAERKGKVELLDYLIGVSPEFPVSVQSMAGIRSVLTSAALNPTDTQSRDDLCECGHTREAHKYVNEDTGKPACPECSCNEFTQSRGEA